MRWAALDGELEVHRTGPEHAERLAELQRIVFPTLAAAQRFGADHYRHHVALFPDGQFCVVDGERVVGMTTTCRYHLDPQHLHHTFDEIIGYGFFTRHDPYGAHFYGADVSVHPVYRGRGIARRLYDARKALVRERGLRGIVTGAMIPGFVHYKTRMDAPTYVARVVAGEIFDPTLSVQLRQGFHVHGLLPNYLADSATDGWSVGVLIRELTTLYEAYRQNEASALAELTIQYADFAEWQREWLRGAVLEEQMSYWREQLAAAPTLELPTDRPHPARQTFGGASRMVQLSEELTCGLRELSRREGVTLFMTLLSGWQTLLARRE